MNTPVPGTHLGKLDPDARQRRAIKNARNGARVHPKGSIHELDMPVLGNQQVARRRLAMLGNRLARGKAR